MTTKKWKKFPSRAGKSPTKTNCPNVEDLKKMSKSVQISKSPFFWFGVSINKKDLNVTSKFKHKKFWKKEFFELKQSCENFIIRILEKNNLRKFFWRRKIAQNIYMMHVTYEKTSIIYSPPSLLSFIKLIVNFFETTYFWFSSFANIHASKPQSQNRIPSPAISKAKKERKEFEQKWEKFVKLRSGKEGLV